MDERTLRGIGMTSARTRRRLIERLRDQGITNEQVLERMAGTPRHVFVDEALASRAYEDTALPIGYGQTISQPYVVARMTEALLASGTLRRVLEIGTGCGYQTAVLASLVPEMYSVERVSGLLRQARERFRLLGLHNVRVRHGDGYQGWDANAPFDAILLTAAPPAIPPALIQQLAEGGCLIAPVGTDGGQELMQYRKRGAEVDEARLGAVSFVPMLGGVV